MSVLTQPDTLSYCQSVAQKAARAQQQLALAGGKIRADAIRQIEQQLRKNEDSVLEANRRDIDAAPGYGLTDAEVDRLRLTSKTIAGMCTALAEIAEFPDPIGEIMNSSMRPSGMLVTRIRVPLGVVFFIYESRPNVTTDAAGICLRSGNAVILRGGKEAMHSNLAIAKCIDAALQQARLPSECVQLINTTDRAAVGHLLAMDKLIQVVIPRGGKSLIDRVTAEARMPVIKHDAGNCHVYVDETANLSMAIKIIINSKCQRLGVCNAAESILVHAAVGNDFLARLGSELTQQGIEIRGDRIACQVIPQAVPASDEDYFAEFLGPICSLKVVTSLQEAIDHINHYGSHHTDAIVSEDPAATRQFAGQVDSAAVVINASTRLNDGGQIGLGAEIGISTDKFHARGPCGVRELTSYKYVLHGAGHVRE